MRSNFRLAQTTPADPEYDAAGKELRFLWIGGGILVAGCVAYLLLFQSGALWDRPIPLPGGEDGPFGAVRNLFPAEWLQAGRGSFLGLLNVGIYLLTLAALFATYWLVLRHALRLQKVGSGRLSQMGGRNSRILWQILLVTGLALFVLLWLPGTQSSDLHSYIWYGRILATFGDNPFIHVPMEYAGRDVGGWLQQVYWKEVPSVYGPVWALLAGGVDWLGNLVSSSDIWPHLLGHKLLVSGAHLANVALMWRVSGLIAQRYLPLPNSGSLMPREKVVEQQRGAQLVATLVYAWCPLALIEFGGNGHNDALMLTGVLSALWLHLTGRWRLAVVVFALAALVKVAALLLLPGYLWLLFHRTKSKMWNQLLVVGQAFLIMAATWTLFYLPFWEGPETLRPLLGGPALTRFTNSFAAMLRFQGGEWLHALATANGWEAIERQSVDAIRNALEGPLRLLALGVTVPIAVAATWRGRTFPLMVGGWGWMLFVYLTVGAVWFWPWYITWLLPIAGLVGQGRLFRAIQILCATSLALYAIYPLMPPPLEQVPYYRSLIMFAPPVAYVVVSAVRAFVWEHKLRLQPGLPVT